MYQEPSYTLRVIWACMKKDIKSALNGFQPHCF